MSTSLLAFVYYVAEKGTLSLHNVDGSTSNISSAAELITRPTSDTGGQYTRRSRL